MISAKQGQHILIGALRAWLPALLGGLLLCMQPSGRLLAQPPEQEMDGSQQVNTSIALASMQAVIPACDPITNNVTWEAGNIYVVQNCNLTIADKASLTIEPGVIVKFGGTAPGYGSALGSAAVIIEGTMHVNGTEANPVIFTSYADDTYGGDTNENGNSSGAAGDWYGLVFQSGSSGQLEHFFVGYAGSGVFNAMNGVGYGRAQIDVKEGALQLRHGTITTGLRKGIYLEGSGITPIIENVQIVHNDDPTDSYGTLGTAIYQANINMQPTYSNLTLSDNDRNEVTIGDFRGDLTQDVTLGGANYGFLCGYTVCQLNVPTGRTLTVAPNTLLDFRASYGIAIAEDGSLSAAGTLTQPITFTSKLAAAENPNQYWMGIWAKPGSNLLLDHCDISYADDGNYGQGGLEINTDNATVSQCKIHHNRQNGLYIYSRDGATIHPTLTNVDVSDNGRYGLFLDTSSGSVNSVTWDGGRISNNGWSGVAASTWNSIINPTLRNLTIADNGASGDLAGRYEGLYWDDHNVNPTLENLTITGNAGAAVYWYCNGSITARNLIATDNGTNELIMPGCALSGGRQWDLGDAGIDTRVTGAIEVNPNSLLSLQPGTSLRFDKNQYGSATGILVKEHAGLYALGTAEDPILFTGSTETPGWWTGIEATYAKASVVLNHCEIAYGANANLALYGNSAVSPSPVSVQNCDIHHSAKKGIFLDWVLTEPPFVRNNQIHDNGAEGITNWNAPVLDARQNYWGAPSGPFHATQNPAGLGDTVGDNILFYPWLTTPSSSDDAGVGRMIVSTGAPSQVSPGETVDFAIQYLSQMTKTLDSSILMLQLPETGHFVESTGGGLYWPDRHQVFWKLGNLAPGANGFVSVRVRFQWGLTSDFADGSLTQFAAKNYNSAALDVAEYNAYESTLLSVSDLSGMNTEEFAILRGANGDLESLYQSALGEGFQYMSAARITYADGTVVVNASLRTPDRKYGRILSLSDGAVLASTVGGGKLDLRDMNGGMSADLNSQTYAFWGSWMPAESNRAGAACTEDRCFYSCMLKAKSWGAVARKVAGAVSWVIPPLGAAWTTYEVYDEITTYQQCKEACKQDPTTHCCTPGEIRWSPTGLKQQCAKYSCDAVGTWKQTPDGISKCGFGERCVAGKGTAGGCKACEEDLIAAQFTAVTLRPQMVSIETSEDAICAAGQLNRCSNLTLRQAKDPNAIYGSEGDLLPGATAAYTVTYENVGEGRAYGVYVVNVLPGVFDPTTLDLHGAGVYLPSSREIVWSVGELGPRGAVDSEGAITYTVALTAGLASGTIIANQAVVYFPSVPEETPTNTWVNLVAPLVATPQDLITNYMTPLAITLHGWEASSLPLTYSIVEDPHGGTLAGTPPNLTYTPAENFTGPDGFSFRVSNGTSESRAAQVRIDVIPNGDVTPPSVLWTTPEADATDVEASVTPVVTDTVGALYTPSILIGVSEALSETTVTTAAVTLALTGGTPVTATVSFNTGINQIVLYPRLALADGMYTVSVDTSVKDLAGNPLAAPYTWRFSVGDGESDIFLPAVQR